MSEEEKERTQAKSTVLYAAFSERQSWALVFAFSVCAGLYKLGATHGDGWAALTAFAATPMILAVALIGLMFIV